MHSKGDGTKLSKWILLGVLAWAAGLNPLYGTRPKHKQDPPKDPPASVDLTKYVGPETCKGCHPDVYKQFETTPHWHTLEFKQKDKMGCEACILQRIKKALRMKWCDDFVGDDSAEGGLEHRCCIGASLGE